MEKMVKTCCILELIFVAFPTLIATPASVSKIKLCKFLFFIICKNIFQFLNVNKTGWAHFTVVIGRMIYSINEVYIVQQFVNNVYNEYSVKVRAVSTK